MIASDNVVPLHVPSRPGAPADITDRVYQRTLMRALSRYWRSVLSDREFSMLAYIMDHTVEWGRLAYRFTYRSLAEGTPISRCGLNKGEQQLRQTLVSLERKGAVCIVRGRDGLAITFNPLWMPTTAPRERPMDAEAPQEIQGPDPWKPKGQTLGNPHLLLEEHLEDQIRRASVASGSADAALRNISTSSDFREPQLEVQSQVRRRQRPARPIGKVDGRTQTPTTGAPELQNAVVTPVELKSHRELKRPGSLWKTWQTAWDEVYGGAVGGSLTGWTMADLGALNKAVVTKWKGDAASLHEFLDWSVREWAMIRVTEFGWMKRDPAPLAPSLKFFLAFHTRFLSLFNRREVDRALSGLNPQERMRREMMIKQGASAEEADREVMKRSAMGMLREEIEEGKAAARRIEREAAVTLATNELRNREHMRRVQRARSQPPTKPSEGMRYLSPQELQETLLHASNFTVEPFDESR